jgi:DNA helicase-2/ATP-dependent DNA helicase PcrA
VSSNGHHHFVPTDEQRQAIEHVHGPMLVVAGAGTGKTTVLARRIAHLIQSEAAKPDEILAVTYTRNSAAELINRVAAILYPGESQQSLYPEMDRPKAAQKLLRSGLQAHTFHSYCYRLLNDAGNKFQLLDDNDLFVLLRRRVGDLKLRHYIKSADPGKFLKELLEFFDSCHDELRTPDDYDAYVKQLERREIPLPRMGKSKDAVAMSDDEILGRCHEIAYAFRYAENLLQQEGLGSFGHIMSRAVDLLTRRQSVLQRAQRRARFILIDEFQDSNVAQIKLASLLAGDEANVFAVGDPDQAIYQFRGASSGAFDQFLNTFGADRVKRVTMSANRRSTQPILRCAYQAIKCNPQILSVEAADGGWPRQPLTCARLDDDARGGSAPAVQAIVPNTLEQEATFIADTIQAMRRERPGIWLSQIGVLYRSHYHREKIVAELHQRGIPVHVKGVDLFDTPELRDAMAVLRILDSTHPVALFRVAALPQFKVDPERFRAQLALLGREGSAEVALEESPAGAAVVEAIRRARQDLIAGGNVTTDALAIARRDFGLAESMPLRRLANFAERWKNKPKQIVEQGTLHEFLEYVTLFREEAGGALLEETDEDDPVAALAPNEVGNAPIDDAVQLMTVHAAKGLEFRYVFVVRIASASFPSNYKEPLVEFPRQLRSKDTAAGSDAKTQHEQEERRLFYVAMTRAMDELYLCGKIPRGKNPIPTRYIRELVSEAGLALKGAITARVLEPELISSLQAAAEPLPNVSQWTQLPPREDGHLHSLSASAIQQYENCPLAYKLKYDWRLPEEASAALQYGSAMHLALKAYFDGVRAGRPPDEETVIACFLDELTKSKIDEPLQRQMYEKDGREQLTALLRSELGRSRGEILETERRFKVQIGGAQVSGRFDRLDRVDGGEVEVVDYKTGKPKTQEDADDSLQLSIYALAARSLGHTPSALVFINLQNGIAIESRRSAQQLLEAEKLVTDVAAKIAAGEFQPDPGPGCRRCSYHSICPEQEAPLPVPLASHAAKMN